MALALFVIALLQTEDVVIVQQVDDLVRERAVGHEKRHHHIQSAIAHPTLDQYPIRKLETSTRSRMSARSRRNKLLVT